MAQTPPSVTQEQALTALRAFLLSILANDIEVVKGEDNRVAEPEGENFVVMTPMLMRRLETNTDTYTDGYFQTPQVPGIKTVLQPTELTVQLDVHGPASLDNANTITALFRDEYATENFRASGFDVHPLYCSDPRQLPFTDGEQQVEIVWTVDAALQINPTVTVPMQFAGTLGPVGLIDVDEKYPP